MIANCLRGQNCGLWAAACAGQALGEIEFTHPARPGQAERTVRQHIWAQRLALADGHGEQIDVTCIMARETEPPANTPPIEWRLLTNRVARSLETATELIDRYRGRWEIEIFFNGLKNGCRIEALQLGSVPKIELALAIYRVVAWRLARLVRLGRTHPELEATELFTDDEWKGAYILDEKPVPISPPTIRDVIRQIAKLGGFLGRNGDGEPGVKTLRLGLQRIRDFANGAEHMRRLHAL
jgi:hypothetical protein